MFHLRAALAASGLMIGLATAALSQDVPEDTTLVVADQSELIRNLLESSGAEDEIGFTLKTPNFAGGPAIQEAMRAGVVDIAYVGDIPPIQARASGSLFPIVLTVTRARSEYRLLVRPGLEVKTLADLRGKRVSLIEGSGRQVFLIEALNRGGLTLKDVTPVPLRIADLPDAIRTGAVDVAVLQEPHVTRLIRQVGASTIPDPAERDLLPSTWYFYARPEVLADPAQHAAIGQFITAVIHAGEWSNSNREAWGRDYYTRFQRIAPEDTDAIIAAQAPLAFQTSAEAIPHHQKLIDVMTAADQMPERFDAAGSFTPDFDAVIEAAR